MFKILKYNQLFENSEKLWKSINLPTVYPSRNHVDNWIIVNRDIIGNTVKCLVYNWDFSTNDYEVDDLEMIVSDIYEDGGYIHIVDDKNVRYKVTGQEIEVKIGKRVFSKEDPYGEEVWESTKVENKLKVGDIVHLTGYVPGAGHKLFDEHTGQIEKIEFHHGHFYFWVIIEGDPPAYVMRRNNIINKCDVEEYLRRREEFRLKYKDIDPYGEEVWESVNELDPYDEEIWNEMGVGSEVICKKDVLNTGKRMMLIYPEGKKRFTKGNVYKIFRKSPEFDTYFLRGDDMITMMFSEEDLVNHFTLNEKITMDVSRSRTKNNIT